MNKWVKIGAAVAVGAIVIEAALVLPLSRWAGNLVEWVRGAGATGVVVYAVVYVSATLLLLPGSLLAAGAGLAYGPLLGTMLVSPVSVAAATLAFAVGRTVARGWVAKRVDADVRFRAIDAAIGRNGLRIVMLLRLSPIFPFNLLNYALGLTEVRLRDFVLGSFIGMLPGTFLYVYLGSFVTSVNALSTSADAGRTAQQVLYWVGLAATVVVTVFVTRIARRALADELADPR
jgi:uncharacterized membrane protein YdjX (TVP38/TMEM64 family)